MAKAAVVEKVAVAAALAEEAAAAALERAAVAVRERAAEVVAAAGATAHPEVGPARLAILLAADVEMPRLPRHN